MKPADNRHRGHAKLLYYHRQEALSLSLTAHRSCSVHGNDKATFEIGVMVAVATELIVSRVIEFSS